jgi:Amt family ammonium transporter
VPVLILFASMLLLMLTRVYTPLGTKAAGKVDKVAHLSLPERTLLQRVNVYSIGAVLLLMSVTGVIASAVEIGVVVIALMILLLPMRCIFTTQGVALNNVVYRPWSDFTMFRVESRRIVLIGKEGTRALNLPVLAAHQRELIPVLRRHLSEAKDGRAISIRRRQAAS